MKQRLPICKSPPVLALLHYAGRRTLHFGSDQDVLHRSHSRHTPLLLPIVLFSFPGRVAATFTSVATAGTTAGLLPGKPPVQSIQKIHREQRTDDIHDRQLQRSPFPYISHNAIL
jgi:hypothetical protein